LDEIRLGPLSTIVGQNDVGKSTILRALEVFFESKPKLDEADVNDAAKPEDNVVIEVSFDSLPAEVAFEEGVLTTLAEEMLLDSAGALRIRKTYPRDNLSKPTIELVTTDYSDDRFAALTALKEKELNSRCAALGIEVSKSGRSVTNKGKRESIRQEALKQEVPLVTRALPLSATDDLWKALLASLPDFHLFEADTKLGVGETSFQSEFKPVIRTAAETPEVVQARDTFTAAIGNALQKEINQICAQLQRHTQALTSLKAIPAFMWDKAVSFDILGKDAVGVEKSIDRRGSGLRRLLMVAFFEYLAEKARGAGGQYIFAVEEPENCLHPGLQRDLVSSFRRLALAGCQVIVSTHSPVFAGASPIDDLALVVREKGVARAIQTPDLALANVARELGVEPSDQITGYNACVFVEGITDIHFFTTIACTLKASKHTVADFADKNIGFVICGGGSLKHWIDLRAMARLSHRFAAVIDSDREDAGQPIPGRKLNWKGQCEQQGGLFFILRKREIENYIHSDAIQRSGRPVHPHGDFTDMKALFGDNIYKVIDDMSSDEILSADRYQHEGAAHHELLEITQTLLALADI